MTKKISQDQKEVFRVALENLDVFTQLKSSCLDIEKGRLIARTELLEKIRSRCLNKIGVFFSSQIREEQEQRLLEMKKVILQSCDIIQSQIETFKEGDDTQRHLANSASTIIERYNAIVAQELSGKIKRDVYSDERERLLQDLDIKGRQIKLPHAVSIKYEAHPSSHPAYKTFEKLSHVLREGGLKKESLSISPTHKKSEQFMVDMFHMKAIRMIELHLKKSVAEIVPLIKETPPLLDEVSDPECISMQQHIQVSAGTIVLVTGCFKRHASPSQFMAMPVPESFRLTFLHGQQNDAASLNK